MSIKCKHFITTNLYNRYTVPTLQKREGGGGHFCFFYVYNTSLNHPVLHNLTCNFDEELTVNLIEFKIISIFIHP